MTNIQSPTLGVVAYRAKLNALAWGAIFIVGISMILVPRLPTEPIVPYQLGWAMVIVLTVLWAMSRIWPAAKPLGGFFLALLAFCAGAFLIVHTEQNQTLLTGSIQDQSALYGLIAKLRDLGVRLVSVNYGGQPSRENSR